ncbi:hypothetical protein [Streptomyces sp. NPDC057689]|uniref:hypothetical protein n=1 Tax=Streptomyces sp. NPDC057689 TaxID=3346213 RepID=UPI00368D54CE
MGKRSSHGGADAPDRRSAPIATPQKIPDLRFSVFHVAWKKFGSRLGRLRLQPSHPSEQRRRKLLKGKVMRTNRKLHSSRHLDLIIFLAVLATGTLLTLIGTSAGALVTITTALSGLYQTWNTGRRSSHPQNPTPADSNRDQQ